MDENRASVRGDGGGAVSEAQKPVSLTDVFPDFRAIQQGETGDCRCDKPALMIAMTPRTGSTHLCAALGAAVDMDSPSELFNPRGVAQAEKKRRGVSTFAGYIESVSRDRGRYVSFKIGWLDFKPMAAVYRKIFPDLKIIYLNRLDVVAQAVSLTLASASGRWHENVGSGEKSLRRDDKAIPAFDLAQICNTIGYLEYEKKNWEMFFFSEFINPARINYESFCDDVNAAIGFIVKHLELSTVEKIDSGVGFRRLSDEVNEEWIAKVNYHRSGRFYADLNRREEASLRARAAPLHPARAS